MSAQVSFILYLVYGFVYLLIGVIVFQQKNQELSGFPIIRTLPLLGMFGILHGLSEWITLIQLSDLYQQHSGITLVIKGTFKVFSFYYLFRFALMTLTTATEGIKDQKIFRVLEKIPILLLLAWFLRLGIIYGLYDLSYFEENRMGSIIINRYLMSFPAGILAFVGLFRSGKKVQRMNYENLHQWYFGLSVVLLVYGIVDGLIVRPMDFFPANILNNQLFFGVTGFPIQVVKILLGILMIYSVTGISRIFEGEKRAVIDEMLKNRAVEVEREKVNRYIHDRIIQKMYGAGMKIEAYLGKENKEYLYQANDDLQQGIKEARDIIAKTVIEDYHTKDLESLIKDFIQSKEGELDFEMIFENQVPALLQGKAPKKTITQMYYILQEAVTNTAKHGKATKLWIRLTGEYDRLTMEIEDDGQGFDPGDPNISDPLKRKEQESTGRKLGLEIMKDRAREIGGKLQVRSGRTGTLVRLDVKWGGEKDE